MTTDNPNRQKSIDSRWAEEAESRISAYDAGLMVADSEENVFTRINQRCGKKSAADSATKNQKLNS